MVNIVLLCKSITITDVRKAVLRLKGQNKTRRKSKMRKPITITLALMMVLLFVACSDNGNTNRGDSGVQNGNSNSTSSTQDDNNSATPLPAQNNKPSYSLADATIVDDENVTFTITSIEESGFWGFSLKVYCENKTDKDLMFSWDKVSVNGYMIDPFWASEIAAGRRSNTEISFFDNALERCNITSVDEIVFTLKAYDSNDWLADRLVNEEFIIYPTGLDANSVVYSERQPTTTEQIIVDNESCIFIIESEETDSIWGYTLNCYIENKTSEPLMFSWDNVSVNGFMIDPFWSNSVQPGKRSYSDISFLSSRFEENSISVVEEIEFELRIYNSDDWTAPKIVEEKFTYAP
jgi:hypothetical protein